MARLEGYAARFNSESSDLGGFVEVIRPGAFTRALSGDGDVFMLHSHRSDQLLGSREAGTLTLGEDATGLRFSLDTPDTTLGRDIAELVNSKVLRGMSFGFIVPRAAGERWSERQDGLLLRELFDVDLAEVSSTQWPAYPAATVTASRSSAKATGRTKAKEITARMQADLERRLAERGPTSEAERRRVQKRRAIMERQQAELERKFERWSQAA